MSTSSVPMHVAVDAPAAVPVEAAARRRHIDPASGRALELLGHAIEYLADEHAFHGGSLAGRDPVMQAMQILMERNRAIYLACPPVLTLGERWRALLGRFQA